MTGPGSTVSNTPATITPSVPSTPKAPSTPSTPSAPKAAPNIINTTPKRVVAPQSVQDQARSKVNPDKPATVIEPNKEIPFDDLEFVTGDKPSAKKPNTDDEVQTNENEEGVESEAEETSFEVPETETETTDDSDTAGVESEEKLPGKRDYSKFDPEVADIARKLNNANFAKYADKLQEWKQAATEATNLKTKIETLTKEKPRFLAEHPEAYRIAPEFNQAKQAYNGAKEQVNFWQDQLLKISEAEAWQEFTGYNDQGQPQFVDHPATPDGRVDKRSEIAVQQHLAQVAAQASQYEQQARGIARDYHAYQKQSINELNDMGAKLFKGADPEKFAGDDKKFYDATLKMLPGQFGDNPLAKYLGMAFVQHRKMVIGYTKALAELKALKTGKAPTNAVGPRGKTVAGSAQSANVVDLNELYNYDK